MDRRSFLRGLVGGVAVTAAARSFPFRVFSFPSEISATPVLSIPWGADLSNEVDFLPLGLVSEELLRDSLFDIEVFCVRHFAVRTIDMLPGLPMNTDIRLLAPPSRRFGMTILREWADG